MDQFDTSESESNYNVIDIRHATSLLSSYDESLIQDSEYLTMTSLRTMLFLSQNESKTPFTLNFDNADDFDSSRLSLAYERLHRIPKIIQDELAQQIKYLDLSYNEFDNLDFLKSFKQLNTLICDHNNINAFSKIPYMPNLELLWMNHCKIRELHPWAYYLQQSCPNLKYLSLMGNVAAPSYLNGGNFYEYLQYRLYIINLFPNLHHLDDRIVTHEQRVEAKRYYKSTFIERLVNNEKLPNCIKNVSNKLLIGHNYLGKDEKNIIV